MLLPSLFFPRKPKTAIGRRTQRALAAPAPPASWWSLPMGDVVRGVESTSAGLSARDAERRLDVYGKNEVSEHRDLSRMSALWDQLKNPLLLLLVAAATASAATAEWADAAIVVVIITASVGIGYSREYRAQTAANALRSRVQTRASVVRDGVAVLVPSNEIVRGDLIVLSAGSIVPADCRLVEATDFFVNEAVLTGESFPVEKKSSAVVAANAPIAKRDNCVFLGTNVRSGTAKAIVVATGKATELGGIAHRLVLRPPETEFERSARRFGIMLTIAMLIMVIVVFAANTLMGRPIGSTLLFSIALAVGLSPELLPAILSVNLARGAQMMAKHGVLVRHLNAIENLGSMDILCTDKTGTLTEGVVRLDGAWDLKGASSPWVLELAAKNATLQAGLKNPLDDAIAAAVRPTLEANEKLGEIPYDFVRKRLSVVVRDASNDGGARLITKGAFAPVLAICDRVAGGGALDADMRASIDARFRAWCAEGTRVLAVATRALPIGERYGRDDERALELAGFLTFLDRPKEGAKKAIADMQKLGVSVKLITGDAELVARHVARAVGLHDDHVLTGKDLDEIHDDALWRAADITELFVEVDPNQKERIIRALKKMSHVVGFMGDGVNDAPAMHAADTSLSVDDAVDVAREAADFVLLERDLDIIRAGIEEGRRTFANTLKYVLTTTSANLGNMVSMAVASAVLPFLPLTAGQILLNNFLSDIPAIGIAGDSVDDELVDKPRRWEMRVIGRFMVEFGLLSSFFDMLTFATLLWFFHADESLFRTGWFVESLLTELLVALVVRTRRVFWKSRPGRFLLVSSVVLVVVALTIPFAPFAATLGFVPLPANVVVVIIAITVLYASAAELLKAHFYGPSRELRAERRLARTQRAVVTRAAR